MIRFKPQEDGQQDVHASLMAQMDELGDARRARLTSFTPTNDRVIWVVLFLGATVTIVFTYVFGLENVGTQMAMT